MLFFGSLSLRDMTATAGGNVATANSFTLYGNSARCCRQLPSAVAGCSSRTAGSISAAEVPERSKQADPERDVTTTGAAASFIMEDTAGGTSGVAALELSGTAAPSIASSMSVAEEPISRLALR
ncbi:MAG: hypothetical protein R3F31_18100 [Verrucomicrobiales bacterium]